MWWGPGALVVPRLVVGQAPPQASEEFIREVAQGGVVVVAGGSASVVVGAGAGGFGEHRERPPVAGVSETFVADFAGLDVVGAARCDRDRSGASIGA